MSQVVWRTSLKWHRGLAALGECLRHQSTTREQLKCGILSLPSLLSWCHPWLPTTPPAIAPGIAACVKLRLELSLTTQVMALNIISILLNSRFLSYRSHPKLISSLP